MPATLRFDNLTLGYDRHPAVHHLTGEVPGGTLLAVVGPNGAGKSTLLKGIAGLLPPIGGSIQFAGNRRRDIAYLPQAVDIERSFPITVRELVALGAWQSIGAFGGFSGKLCQKVGEAILAVGLTGLEHRPIGTLSGGQLQRALFARLLLQDAPVILLDEPFSAIDQSTTADLVKLVQRWHRESRTVIAVLHDMALVREIFPEALLLARDPVAWGPTAATISPANLASAQRLVEIASANAPICERAA